MPRFGFSPGSRHGRKEVVEPARKEVEPDKTRRRNFGFLKNADKRPTSTTLSKTREHAKELALAWDEPLGTPNSFQSGHGLLQTSEPFDPFGNGTTNTAETDDFQFSFSNRRTMTNASGSLFDSHFTTAASPEPTASTLDTFDTSSVGSAFDMDFLPTKSSNAFQPASSSSSSAQKPKKKPLDQFVAKTKSPASWAGHDASAARSMATFPSNSSMQSNFTKQSTNASTAASRRKARNQIRHSSNNSVTSSVNDDVSWHSDIETPPASPVRPVRNGTPSSNTKNRLPTYQRPQTTSMFSVASSVGNSSNQSSSNRSASEINLFDSQNPNGGFTFDAFGLDQAQVEKEVNDAMHALAGQGMPGFSVFFNNDTDGDFSSQGWDSPAASRRSSPAPAGPETDGFVDGFRISPTSKRRAQYSPASSEQSFSSPAATRRAPSSAMGTITPPRWETPTNELSRDLFGDSQSNPWKDDPWGSDSGADSDFGDTQSEIVNSFFNFPQKLESKFPETKSDIGVSTFRKSIGFQNNVRRSPQKHASAFGDELSEDGFVVKTDLAREYALELVKRVSPRQAQHGSSPEGHAVKEPQSRSQPDVSRGGPSGFVGEGDNGFGDAQEEMFQAEFGFPVSDSDFGNDSNGSDDFETFSPSRRISEDLSLRFDEHHDQVGVPAVKSALHPKQGGKAVSDLPPQSTSTAARIQNASTSEPSNVARGPDTGSDLFVSQSTQKPPSSYGKLRNPYEAALPPQSTSTAARIQNADTSEPSNAARGPDSDAFVSRSTQKPPSSYGKLRNSYEAAKSRLSLERTDPVSAPSNASDPAVPSRSKNDERDASTTCVEEKKEEEPKSPLHDGEFSNRISQWQRQDIKSNQVVPSLPPQPAPTAQKWKQSGQGARHAALAGVEMLTPDIVESRRQEKRKTRAEELRQSSQPSPGVLKMANNLETSSSSVNKQQANEGQVERSSYASLRERLKPASAVKAKSEVGAYPLGSASLNVIDRVRQISPRAGGISDVKSDGGSSPQFLAGEKLLKTVGNFSKGGNQSDGTFVDSPSHRFRRSVVPHMERDDPARALTVSTKPVGPKETSLPVVPVEPTERKLSYRERRDLELKKEQEIHKAKLEAEKKEEPKKDVASLIRQRIAANKQKAATSPTTSTAFSKATQLRTEPQQIALPAGQSPKQHTQNEKNGNQQRFQTQTLEEPQCPTRLQLSGGGPTGFGVPNRLSETSYPEDEAPADESPRQLNQYRMNGDQQQSPTEARDRPRWQLNQQEKNGNQQPSPTEATDRPRYPSRFESSEASTSFRKPYQAPSIGKLVDPEGGSPREDFLAPSGTKTKSFSAFGSHPQSVGSYATKSPPSSQHGAEGTELGDARFATSSRLEALLSKKNEDPKDFSVTSTPSAIPKPVNRPAFEPPDDGAAGKNDVKAMLSGLLGARMNPFASLPAPKKEDDFDAIMELKSFESKHSPEKNTAQTPEPARPPSAVTNGQRPALKDDPKYERYFRMLKVGMPMEVVKHAMQKDGADPSVMDGDHNLPVGGLALKDDPIYAKYFKMLKMGIPLPQVKHGMQRDGLNPDVMDQDHNLPAAASEKKPANEPIQKDTKRRARLHWKTLQKVNLNSLWSKIQKEPEVTNINFDEDEFEELFQADLAPSLRSPKGIGSARKKGAAVRVIDAKRANNGGIILARVKMSHDEMADVVDRIDGDALTAEQIENIIEYLPTKEERIQLEKYMLEGGEDAAEKFDGLCECEKFMVSMMTVKHAKRKVTALLFKLQFIRCLQSIAEDTQMIDDACDELKHCTRLRQLLGIVLQFGNRLNTAGKSRQNKAGAFTLDSLLKLSQAKAFDKKTTFLHYVVMIVHRNSELLLNFTDDLPTCMRADKIYWDQCLQDLEEVENQLENVRRISLYEAKARKFNLQKRKTKDDDDDSIGDLELSLEQEVEALRATPTGLFTLSAIKQVSALRDKVESTRKKFVRVLEYFGEDKDSMQPHELFHIFCVFGRDFNKAKEEAFASMKKKQREERKQAGKNQQQTATNGVRGKPPSVPERNTLRASNLQPSMSKVITDLRGTAKQPQQRPTTAVAQKDKVLHQASNVSDHRRTLQTRADVQTHHEYSTQRGEAAMSKFSRGPSTIPDAYGGRSPRLQQETSQFHDSDLRSTGKQPQQRPTAALTQKGKVLSHASIVSDHRRTLQTRADIQTHHEYSTQRGEAATSKISRAPSTIPDAYGLGQPNSQSPISGGHSPRLQQETSQFYDSPNVGSQPQPGPVQAMSAAESLRQKARNRSQRVQTVASRPTPVASNVSTSESRSPRSSPNSSPEDNNSSHSEMVMGSSASASSRASMRHRRMQAIKRINASKTSQSRNDWGSSSQVSTY